MTLDRVNAALGRKYMTERNKDWSEAYADARYVCDMIKEALRLTERVKEDVELGDWYEAMCNTESSASCGAEAIRVINR